METTQDKSREIAETIRNQIGSKALFMLGAKNLVIKENGFAFRIRGSKKVNYISITLNSLDLYDMEFGKIHGLNYKEGKEYKSIYFDQLHELIELETGLYTSL